MPSLSRFHSHYGSTGSMGGRCGSLEFLANSMDSLSDGNLTKEEILKETAEILEREFIKEEESRKRTRSSGLRPPKPPKHVERARQVALEANKNDELLVNINAGRISQTLRRNEEFEVERPEMTPLMNGLLPGQFYKQHLSGMTEFSSDWDLSDIALDENAKTTGHKYWTHVLHKTLSRRREDDGLIISDIDAVIVDKKHVTVVSPQIKNGLENGRPVVGRCQYVSAVHVSM
eukprot:sb/3469406/